MLIENEKINHNLENLKVDYNTSFNLENNIFVN